MTEAENRDDLNYAILNVALSLGYEADDVFAAVQEMTIVAKSAIPGTTVTDHVATQRLLHLATVGILYEKGMLTERKT